MYIYIMHYTHLGIKIKYQDYYVRLLLFCKEYVNVETSEVLAFNVFYCLQGEHS